MFTQTSTKLLSMYKTLEHQKKVKNKLKCITHIDIQMHVISIIYIV